MTAFEDFGIILLFQSVVSSSFVLSIIISKLVSPRSPHKDKGVSFECGEEPSGAGRNQFVFHYYPYLLLFLVFDVTSMFLFAWATASATLGFNLHVIVVAFLLTILPPLAIAINLASKKRRWY